jgi:hypothetical protein
VSLLTATKRLDRHHIRAKVGQMLDADRPHQEMIEADNANAVEKGHGISEFASVYI